MLLALIAILESTSEVLVQEASISQAASKPRFRPVLAGGSALSTNANSSLISTVKSRDSRPHPFLELAPSLGSSPSQSPTRRLCAECRAIGGVCYDADENGEPDGCRCPVDWIGGTRSLDASLAVEASSESSETRWPFAKSFFKNATENPRVQTIVNKAALSPSGGHKVGQKRPEESTIEGPAREGSSKRLRSGGLKLADTEEPKDSVTGMAKSLSSVCGRKAGRQFLPDLSSILRLSVDLQYEP
ncbi:unnamed protein product [Protopolystoma xenopodis]|uniref:Uncharacterized protein n=1 Tax=Protopolystoma xenopodis TaxID=117903 RepID=A0A3S5A0I1_9PLAT|nr:unnamed protein product [Protopolystoma xenopodis]